MVYNKAWEEKKWRSWKEDEEKELRRLGVSEDVILRLYEADWEDFKTERRFFDHYADTDTYIEWQAADEIPPDIRTVQDLLDGIENLELHQLLLSVDKLMLQIALWRMEGFTSEEISHNSGLSINAINRRIYQLRRKLKNIL